MQPCSYCLHDLGELIVQPIVDEPSTFARWLRDAPVHKPGNLVLDWFKDNHIQLLKYHIGHKMIRQYTCAKSFVEVLPACAC